MQTEIREMRKQKVPTKCKRKPYIAYISMDWLCDNRIPNRNTSHRSDVNATISISKAWKKAQNKYMPSNVNKNYVRVVLCQWHNLFMFNTRQFLCYNIFLLSKMKRKKPNHTNKKVYTHTRADTKVWNEHIFAYVVYRLAFMSLLDPAQTRIHTYKYYKYINMKLKKENTFEKSHTKKADWTKRKSTGYL